MESSLTKHPVSLRSGLPGLALVAVLVFLAALAVWMIAARYVATAGRPLSDPLELPQSAFTEATGVRVTQVAVTAQGGMIDLRYQVIDPDKAAIAHDRNNPPAVVDEATGQVINRPWMDHSHGGKLQPGVTYYLILVNPGGLIKPGSEVAVVIGNARLEHVIAQ